jgi:hypothetical protein
VLHGPGFEDVGDIDTGCREEEVAVCSLEEAKVVGQTVEMGREKYLLFVNLIVG